MNDNNFVYCFLQGTYDVNQQSTYYDGYYQQGTEYDQQQYSGQYYDGQNYDYSQYYDQNGAAATPTQSMYLHLCLHL